MMCTHYYPAFTAVLALSIALGGPGSGGSGEGLSAEHRQALAAIPEVYAKRALASDWDAVAELYHEKAIKMLPDVPLIEGREAIRASLARIFGAEGGVRLTDFSVDIQDAEVLGDAVLVSARYRFEVEPLGDAGGGVQQHGPYVNILRQDAEGTWRIWRQFVGRAHPPVGLDGQ